MQHALIASHPFVITLVSVRRPMQLLPHPATPRHAKQQGHGPTVSQSGVSMETGAPTVPEIFKHPPHTFEGTAPAPDSVIIVDPGV